MDVFSAAAAVKALCNPTGTGLRLVKCNAQKCDGGGGGGSFFRANVGQKHTATF